MPILGFDARLARAALDDEIGIGLCQALRRAGLASCRAKERPVLIVGQSRRGEIFIHVDFELVMAGRFMLLAALFMEPHPAAPPLREVIAHVHLHTAPMRAKV